MAIIITTGDEQKCRQINLLECPICGQAFELTEGLYLSSALLDSRVLVCKAHTEITPEDELKIQDALQRAMVHPRGKVQKNCVLLKRSKMQELANYQITKDW